MTPHLHLNTGFPVSLTLVFFLLFSLPTTAQTGDSGLPFAVYLEAECADIGENWEVQTDSLASQDSFIVIKGGFNSLDVAPEDVPANYTRFRVFVQEMDEFHLWGRVQAESPATDSYWVRVNGGTWVKWFSRLRDLNQWRWREVVSSPFAVPAGEMVIDFAYREEGTKLDKIYVTSLRQGLDEAALGGPSINCDSLTQCAAFPEACVSEAWFEAECGTTGSQWQYLVDPNTSNSGYLTTNRPNNLEPPADTDVNSVISFETELTKAGDYFMNLRVNAPGSGSNSLWIKVDEQDWMEFSTSPDGTDLATDGFEWKLLNEGGDVSAINLNSGKHVIKVAVREFGTQLDKIALTQSQDIPVNYGKVQLNCRARVMTSTSPAIDQTTQIDLYPNPAGDYLTLSLSDGVQGRIDVTVLDAMGRKLQQRTYSTVDGQLNDRLEVGELPAGLYRLLVTSDRGRASRTFVKQ